MSPWKRLAAPQRQIYVIFLSWSRRAISVCSSIFAAGHVARMHAEAHILIPSIKPNERGNSHPALTAHGVHVIAGWEMTALKI